MSALRRMAAGAVRRLGRLGKRPDAQTMQLEMVWPEARLADPPELPLVEGYTLREFRSADRDRYLALLTEAGMPPCPLEYWDKHLLPGGFFVIQQDASGALVATCMASHHPTPRHPSAGNLGWLAASPAHSQRGLGRAAAAAVTRRLLGAGYRRLYLTTDDFRLAAIRIYLHMGWVPLLYAPGMQERWRSVCGALHWPYTPHVWPE